MIHSTNPILPFRSKCYRIIYKASYIYSATPIPVVRQFLLPYDDSTESIVSWKPIISKHRHEMNTEKSQALHELAIVGIRKKNHALTPVKGLKI